MKKLAKKRLGYIIMGILIISVGLVALSYFKPEGLITFEYGSGEKFSLLSVYRSILINCNTIHDLWYVDVNGNKQFIGTDTKEAVPYANLQGFSVTSRTGIIIKEFQGSFDLQCNSLPTNLQSIGIYLTGKEAKIQVYATKLDGSTVKAYEQYFPLAQSAKIKVDGKRINLVKYTIPADKIEQSLGVKTIDSFPSSERFRMSYQLNFMHGQDIATWIYPLGVSELSLRTNINSDVTTPSKPKSNEVTLNWISPADKLIDLSKSKRQISVEGVLPQWTVAESYPILKMYYEDAQSDAEKANPQATFTLTTHKGTDPVIFPFTTNLRADAPYGSYKLVLTSALNEKGDPKRTEQDVQNFRTIRSAETKIVCEEGSIFVDDKCEKEGAGGDGTDGDDGDEPPTSSRWIECLQTFDLTCLTEGQYVIWYIAILVVIIIIWVATRSRPPQMPRY